LNQRDAKSKEIYFLNSRNEPVLVKSIEKVNYSGKIYDVDVKNDIVLVRRGKNSNAIWSGNSNKEIQKQEDKLNKEAEKQEKEELKTEEKTERNIGITGNIIRLFSGITARVIEGFSEEQNLTEIPDLMYNNTITVYIERDFTNTSYNIGDIITLDPTLIIIEITKAEHLDSNRSFISDIYEETKAKDDIWSEVINDSHYVRAYFSKNLTKYNDITIYARSKNWNNSVVIDGKEVSYDIYLKKKRIDELRRELNMS
jgi:hypothetical protein